VFNAKTNRGKLSFTYVQTSKKRLLKFGIIRTKCIKYNFVLWKIKINISKVYRIVEYLFNDDKLQ
jgi:hypothetical protein